LCIVDMSTVYTNETNLSFWLRLCRARLFVTFVVRCLFGFWSPLAPRGVKQATKANHGWRQRRPSRAMKSSASFGPHVPAS
jgi:hypothetical protein